MAAAQFSAYEVIEIAIEMEKNGEKLYKELGAVCKERTASDVFKALAESKPQQVEQYQKLLAKVKKEAPAEAYPGEYTLYLKNLADDHSGAMSAILKKAVTVHTTLEAVELALDHKKNTLLYLQELGAHVDKKDADIVSELIKKKQADMNKLIELKKKAH